MNILKHIDEEQHMSFVNYGPNDLSTVHFISKLIDNYKEIISYYLSKEQPTINNIDDYIDILFLDYIISFNDFVDVINTPYKETIKELINNALTFKRGIENKKLIAFIDEQYIEIFSYRDNFLSEGLKKRTKDYIIKFNKGLHFEKIMAYLMQYKIIFFIDNIESFYPIIKKHNKTLMNNIFKKVVPYNKIIKYRFEEVCELCLKFYRLNEIELSHRLANKLYTMLRLGYDSFVGGEQPYKLVKNFKIMTRTLKAIKNKNYYEAKDIYNKVEKLSDEYLMKHGQVHEYEISNKKYINLIEKTVVAKLHDMDKIFLLSHRFDKDQLWSSVLESFNNELEPSIMDMISSPTDTNDYFTLSRQQMNQHFIDEQSVNVAYWLSEKRIDKFFSILSSNVQIISSEINLHLELKTEINYLKNAVEVISESKNTRQDILIYSTVFYVITLIEKILRELFVHYEENAIFNIEHHTLSKLLDDKNVIVNLVGPHQIKWLRFYLLRRDNVGLDFRNRMAHFRDININEFYIFDLFRMLWFLTSTINSILINIINDELGE